jgi:3-hydroxyisobutyrate dehydrogenase-like beta-hydroxyacid dehydrogenase
MTKRIGFIGAGLMGHGVARNILAGGYPVALLAHRNRAPIDDLLGRGATEADSPAELAAACDLLFTCVSDSAVLEELVRRPDGIAAGAKEGLILVDLTTAEPSSTKALAAELACRGVRMLDAPMTLTPIEAEAGTLNLLVGGEAALLAEIRPVLDTFCARIFHIGPLGSAHTLKLINNFLTLGNTALVIEACTTALKAGVDPKMMHELISVSGGNSVIFQRFAGLLIGQGDPAKAAFAIKNALKDVSYFWRLAEAEDAYAPMADAIRRYYDLAVALGYGERLLPELFALQGRLCGVPVELKTGVAKA